MTPRTLSPCLVVVLLAAFLLIAFTISPAAAVADQVDATTCDGSYCSTGGPLFSPRSASFWRRGPVRRGLAYLATGEAEPTTRRATRSANFWRRGPVRRGLAGLARRRSCCH